MTEEPNAVDPDVLAHQLAAEGAAMGRPPTAWFDRLYQASADDGAVVPWDRHAPHELLVGWCRANDLADTDSTAVVVGCGLGDDAEFLSERGFDTSAFDVSPSAIRQAQQRFPASLVQYRAADLFDLPAEWDRAFDLVVEIMTVQSLPTTAHRRASDAIAAMVAPGGRLVVIGAVPSGGSTSAPAADGGPPWPLTRAEIDAFADTGLEVTRVEEITRSDDPQRRRWCAEFRRPA